MLKSETTKLIGKTWTIHSLTLVFSVFYMSPKARATKEKLNKCSYIRVNKLFHGEESYQQQKKDACWVGEGNAHQKYTKTHTVQHQKHKKPN